MPSKNKAGCGCCGVECDMCSTASADQYQVDFGVITNGSCTDCVSSFSEQSFVLTREESDPCLWTYTFGTPGLACGGVFITNISLQLTGGFIQVLITMLPGGSVESFTWYDSVGSPYDCASIDGLSVTLQSIPMSYCGGSPTCVLTAL